LLSCYVSIKGRPDPKIPYEERYPNRFPGELEYIELTKLHKSEAFKPMFKYGMKL
jgi:hypothetical protein